MYVSSLPLLVSFIVKTPEAAEPKHTCIERRFISCAMCYVFYSIWKQINITWDWVFSVIGTADQIKAKQGISLLFLPN